MFNPPSKKELRELRGMMNEEEKLAVLWKDVKKSLKEHLPNFHDQDFIDELKRINSEVSKIEWYLHNLQRIHAKDRSKYAQEMDDVMELKHLLFNLRNKPELLTPILSDIAKIVADLEKQKMLLERAKKVAASIFEFEKREGLPIEFEKIHSALVELFAPDNVESMDAFEAAYMQGHELTKHEILALSHTNPDHMRVILEKFAEMDSRLVDIKMDGNKFLAAEIHSSEFGYCLGMFLAIIEYGITSPFGVLILQKKEDLEMEWNVYRQRIIDVIPDAGQLIIQPKIAGIMRKYKASLDKPRLALLQFIYKIYN